MNNAAISQTTKEIVLQFGPGRRLTGILSMPQTRDPRVPAILISNCGLDHRVGPNRLHVHLGRALAEAGFCVLRFDLSGMGDSANEVDGRADAVADMQYAMDELQRRGLASRFVPMGLCSGAHDAHRLAVDDERICGAAFLDGYAYPTMRFKLKAWVNRFCEPQRFLRYFRKRLSAPDQPQGLVIDDIEYFVPPPIEQAREDILSFMRRQLPLCFVFTGGLTGAYNYRTQLFDNFPMLRGYSGAMLRYFPFADHTFSRREMRADLVGLIRLWLQQQYMQDRMPPLAQTQQTKPMPVRVRDVAYGA